MPASSSQDVVDAWNRVCAGNNLGEITLNMTGAVEDVYTGSEPETDLGEQSAAMANLLASAEDLITIDDVINADDPPGVTTKPWWFQSP